MFFSNPHHSIHQNSIDDFKPSTFEISTAVHNSPTTTKFKFLNEDQTALNCSFDEGGQSGHAKNIVDVSVIYLKSSLQGETACLEGFNNQQLYELTQNNSVFDEKTFDHLILQNGNLTIQQKHEFIRILRNQSELRDLFTQLSSLFNLTVFQQVAYLIFKIWEERHELLQSNLESDPFQNCVLPHFNCFTNLQNGQTFPSAPYVPYKEKKSYEKVQKEAQACSHSFANQMFYDTKLKLLSLRECKRECKSEDIVRSSFGEFFKILTSSIYLSLQGFFCESDDQSNMFIDSEMDSEEDFEIRSDCSLDQFMPDCNFYSRNFSQLDQKDEEQEEENLAGKKKRKLQ